MYILDRIKERIAALKAKIKSWFVTEEIKVEKRLPNIIKSQKIIELEAKAAAGEDIDNKAAL